VFVDFQYDNMGRTKLVTNPYRAADTIYWTETFYDALGRITKIKSPDGSEATSDYSLAASGARIGTVETKTDEAGNVRRTVTDAFARLVRVDEPGPADILGSVSSPAQPTLFSFDTLGNSGGNHPRRTVPRIRLR
jgi:hypothetical protein